ncbi:hypothetical protein M0651_22660 [Paenibacillus sp. MBLB2552]|uniref:Uncharacterized protein n=1 Tax=Paenibacillus mellifer TaxID=2937794 RepID=A0A9X2BRZ4_9BACL|nr:hypothetical protein [Paenibacillus mellifer]MCK8489978.1 hypothetical protein [Paenibacillus mellifer]
MKKKVIITISCFIIFVAIYLIYDYHRPQHIEVKLKGTIYSIESKFEKQTSISIIGEHYRVLFGKDILLGKMIVDDDLVYHIKLRREDNKYFELLTKIDDEDHVIKSIGSIMTSIEFDKVWLQLDDINEKYNLIEGYVSGPAKNMEEGNGIATSIIEGRE